MPVSADIYGRIQQPRANNLLRDYANVMGIQQAQQQNELGRLKMDEYQRATQERNSLADLYRSSLGADGQIDRAKLLSGAASGGLGAQIPALQKNFADQDKALADVDKVRGETRAKALEMAKTRIGLASQAFGHVRQNPTPETAFAVLDYLGQNGVYTPEQVDQYKAKVQAEPGRVGEMAEMAFRAALDAKEQLEKISTQNLGGTSQTTGVDPVTGKSRVLRSDAITQSADNLATNAQSDKNNQRSVNASLANAAANRDIAGAQREATAAWQNQSRELQLDKMRADKADRDRSKQASIDSASTQIGVIDKALNHPGRETSTGLSGTVDPRNYIPGTDASDFRAVLDQINGTAFLQAFESLKGGGQITEVEGRKATEAIARLNRAQSDAEFEKSLLELRGVMEKGYERLTGQKAPKRQEAASGPKVGTVEGGYRFKGGNPADPKNWEKQ